MPRLSPTQRARADAEEREHYAVRVRALEGRLERMRTTRHLISAYGELVELQEWWAHADSNAEALRIIETMAENFAGERARRRFEKATRARLEGRTTLAEKLWQEGLRYLRTDWPIFYRRRPVPTVEPMVRGP